MNEKEAREIIDNMSEQELNDFIFFSLQEVEKENQKLKTELENKDKEIQFQKEINKTEQDRHKQTEKSLKGQLQKKDKQIEQYQNMLATNDMLHVLECEKKDKMIEYMANFINDNTPYTKDTKILENERGVRNTKYTEQYFENKVTDTNVGERKVENG